MLKLDFKFYRGGECDELIIAFYLQYLLYMLNMIDINHYIFGIPISSMLINDISCITISSYY